MTGGSDLADPSAADASDPLGAFLDRFEAPDPSVSYLDGNSLGRPPRAARAVADALLDTWAGELVGAWDTWIDRPLAVGDLLAPVVGAAPGQVVLGDSTTVALHRALGAAVAARPDRSVIVAASDDFPTDRYVAEGVATATGREVRWVPSLDPDAVLDALGPDVAALLGSVAHFETAGLADITALTEAAQEVGALVVWDCSHAAGAVPLELDRAGADLAVGCTYKYLHGGPGAPAFTYVAARHAAMRQPIQGWFGQRDQFAMGPTYEPSPGPSGWLAGTPAMLSLEVAAAGIGIVADAGLDAIRAKSLRLGQVMLDAFDQWFEPLGFTLASPRDPGRRGGHVALRHPDASRVVRAGRTAGVVTDFRGPDLVRLGPGPLATSHRELVEGLRRLRDVVAEGRHQRLPLDPGRVT
jgi:kynureninase